MYEWEDDDIPPFFSAGADSVYLFLLRLKCLRSVHTKEVPSPIAVLLGFGFAVLSRSVYDHRVAIGSSVFWVYQ